MPKSKSRKRPAATAEAVLHAAEEEVDLVSGGGTVYGVPLALGRYIARSDRIPTSQLRDSAIAFYYDPRWQPDDEHLGTDEERQAWEDFVDWCVSEFLTEPRMTREQVSRMNENDRIQLFRKATHQDLREDLEAVGASFRLRAVSDALAARRARAEAGA